MTFTEFLTNIGVEASSLGADDLKAFEALYRNEKLGSAFSGIVNTKKDAVAAAAQAKKEREDFDALYTAQFLPELQRVTKDAMDAKAEKAALEARLAAAENYGLVDPAKKADPKPNANPVPGSPSGDYLTKNDLSSFQGDAALALAKMNDLSARHQSLYGAPLTDFESLMREAAQQRTLGRNVSVEDLWKQRYKVDDKEREISAKKQKEHDEMVSKEAVQKYVQEHGSAPHLRSPGPSRFSQYSAAQSNTNEPWKASRLRGQAGAGWREFAQKKLATA